MASLTQEREHREAYAALMAGDPAAAGARYAAIGAADPGDAVAFHHLALCLYQGGDMAGAREAIAQSLTLAPANAEGLYLQGLILSADGDEDAATEALTGSLALKPDNGQVLNDLGNIRLRRGEAGEATQLFLRAVELDPQSFVAHYNLGVAVQRAGQLDLAVQAFNNAIVLKPDFAEAHCNLGLALVDLGRAEEGIAAYEQALRIRPDFPEAYANMAQPLANQRRLEEAEAALRRAIALRPDFVAALENHAAIKRLNGDVSEALELSGRALALDPSNAKLRVDQINMRRLICDWTYFHQDARDLRAMPGAAEPFVYMNSGATAAEQLVCARRWAEQLPRLSPYIHPPATPHEKLRIGYLSADFRRHATAYLMAELIERHDRGAFEVFGYSYGYDDDSEERRRLVDGFDRFVELGQASHTEAAQRIFEDRIDILIDLKGYTGSARTPILTARPAPIQVNYLGYPGSMGADFIDYVIGDRIITPLIHQPFYSEAIVQLPGSYQPNDTQRKISDRVFSRADCGLPDAGFVFCSFNGAYKLAPDIFDVWMRLLQQTPGSVLWLLSASVEVEANLRREASAQGVDPTRLVFCPPLPLADHLARHALADLFLDTSPINAHTTASDALWAGLPLLTLLGDAFSGRVAASLLQAVGLPELIAPSMADYEAIALSLARDGDLAMAVRRKLKAGLASASLFDIGAYARGLETAFREMWTIRLSGAAPRQIVVSAEA